MRRYYPFKSQPHKMVKQTQTIRAFDHFVELTFKELIMNFQQEYGNGLTHFLVKNGYLSLIISPSKYVTKVGYS